MQIPLIMNIVDFLGETDSGGLFCENSRVEIFFRECAESKGSKIAVEAAYLEGAKRRITANAVRNTLDRMINARDTPQGHFTQHTMNLVKQARAKRSLIPEGSDLNAMATRIETCGMIRVLTELTPHKESRYYPNYIKRLAAIVEFARIYTLLKKNESLNS